jgi:hypothetical protein
MKKIIFSFVLIASITSCSKERTCSCTSETTGTRNTKIMVGTTTISDTDADLTDTDKYDRTVKATKKELIRNLECYNSEYDLSQDNYTQNVGSGGIQTVTYTGKRVQTCEIK